MARMSSYGNPAENELEQPLSLDDFLISRPTSTFFIRLVGDSMEPTIPDGAILVVDRAAPATNGKIVVVSIDNEFLVKEIVIPKSGTPYLHSHNSRYPDIQISDESDSRIWGVCVGFAKKL